MNHIEEITEGLMEVFRALKTGDMEAKDAMEINNTAGKIISAYKTRIAYHALRGDTPSIDGLNTTPKTIASLKVTPLPQVATASGKAAEVRNTA